MQNENHLTFYDAIRKKYLLENESFDFLNIVIKQKFAKDLEVELVGKEYAIESFKSLNKLEQIILSDLNINSCQILNENDLDLKNKLLNLKKIKFLDISFNKLSNWNDIIKILGLFPYLQEFNITANSLNEINLDDLKKQQNCCINCIYLIAGRLNLKWNEFLKLDQIFKNLAKLYIFENNLTELYNIKYDSFSNLTFLSLSGNKLSWDNILKLGILQKLQNLQVDFCEINEIHFYLEVGFKNLKFLNLNNNLLNDWLYICNLNKLNALECLLIRNNPLFYNFDNEKISSKIIAILSNLKVLDKQLIVDKRKDAEIYFLRTHYKDYKLGNLDHLNLNEKMQNLFNLYGEPIELLNDKKIMKRIFVNLKYMDEAKEIKLLNTMSVHNLKALSKKLFQISPDSDVELWCYKYEIKAYRYIIDQDNQSLGFFNVENNSVIEVIKI